MSPAFASDSARTSFAPFAAWATRAVEAGARLLGGWRTRFLIGSAFWSALVLAVGWQTLTAQFSQQVNATFASERVEHAGELSRLIERDARGALSLQAPLSDPEFLAERSGYYWQAESETGEILRSPSLGRGALALPLAFADPREEASVQAVGETGAYEAFVRKLQLASGENVRVVVATDLRLAKPLVRNFDRATRRILLFVAAGMLLTMLGQAYVGFLPLTRLQREVKKIKAGHISRLPEDVALELRPTVTSLNRLLASNEAAVERARVLAGNLAHSLKTPLSIIVDEAAALARSHAAGDPHVILQKCDQIRWIVDFQLTRLRAAAITQTASARTLVAPAVADVVRALARLHPDREIDVDPPPRRLQVSCERQDFEEIFANLLDNALKWAKSSVRVRVEVEDDQTTFVIDDDGPGMSGEDIGKAFQMGARLDERVPGNGFGLAVVKELVELYGGAVSLLPREGGGLSARFSLPLKM